MVLHGVCRHRLSFLPLAAEEQVRIEHRLGDACEPHPIPDGVKIGEKMPQCIVFSLDTRHGQATMVGVRQIEPGVEIFLLDQPTDRIDEHSKIENQPYQWLIAAHTQDTQIPQIIAKKWKTCGFGSSHVSWKDRCVRSLLKRWQQ